ncbi:hypothetical protein MUCCIDRAFT_105728 [Mucor lusitanicus CBS 277.49]|uniref:Molybdopterin synthase sulfur carrier subunit n=1 Tax=Mucor lusitanicus CBS 277.49 TaxID=747725 RepID=A0A168Q6B3_MUCCL|nr:hypothetical protein MUCCIDRAFT_105728 [Mucor lusitanicus CBS 277.49]
MVVDIKVLYFAGVKDITRKESEDVDIPVDNWTLTDLTSLLITKYGDKLKELLSMSMYAVDMDYVEKEKESSTILKPNAEVAIIPPVSGG